MGSIDTLGTVIDKYRCFPSALFRRNFLRVYSTIISGTTNSLAGAWEYGGRAPGKFV